MVDPRVRQERLRSDFQAMQRLRSSAIDFETDTTSAPDRYRVRFRLRSLLGVRGDTPVYTSEGHVHQLEIRLPQNYPATISNDDVTFMSNPIFHPNVFTDGKVCIRRFSPSESLAQFVVRLAKYIQCDPGFIGNDSPANSTAKEFFVTHPGLFPTDRTVLPDPTEGVFPPAPPTPAGRKIFNVRQPSSPAPLPKRRFVVKTPSASAGKRRFVVSSERPEGGTR